MFYDSSNVRVDTNIVNKKTFSISLLHLSRLLQPLNTVLWSMKPKFGSSDKLYFQFVIENMSWQEI